MPYELRLNGRTLGTYATRREAVERARAAVKADPDHEPEVIDTATGRAAVAAGSTRWRDELANKVGY